MKLGHVAIDQYETTYHIPGGESPRKWLLEHFNRRRADRIFIDSSDGPVHIGYVIAGRWFRIYEVHSWDKKKT